ERRRAYVENALEHAGGRVDFRHASMTCVRISAASGGGGERLRFLTRVGREVVFGKVSQLRRLVPTFRDGKPEGVGIGLINARPQAVGGGGGHWWCWPSGRRAFSGIVICNVGRWSRRLFSRIIKIAGVQGYRPRQRRISLGIVDPEEGIFVRVD